jgi:regulatory protein
MSLQETAPEQPQEQPQEQTDKSGRLSGTITALEVQARDQSRVNLYLDGRFAFGLNAKTATEAGLKKGDYLSPDRIATLLKDEERERAMMHAFNLLSFRSRSVVEMERYLRGKGYAPETIALVIGRLRDLHYLDDSTFALTWVENRQRAKPRGPHLLRSELIQKGIDKDAANQAIADASGDEEPLALEAARQKAATLKAADYPEFSRKLGGYLSRRGYSSDVVWSTVKSLWQERTGATANDDL